MDLRLYPKMAVGDLFRKRDVLETVSCRIMRVGIILRCRNHCLTYRFGVAMRLKCSSVIINSLFNRTHAPTESGRFTHS